MYKLIFGKWKFIIIFSDLLRSFMVSSLFRLFLLFTQTRAYPAVAEGRHCHHHYCHHHHYDHQSHHDNMITLIMSRYGHCYEYLSGGAMFSACSCLAGTKFVNNRITNKKLLQCFSEHIELLLNDNSLSIFFALCHNSALCDESKIST